MKPCPWPEGCSQWASSDDRLCYAHSKHAAELLDLHWWDTFRARRGRGGIFRTTLDAAILSDEQMEIAHLLSSLGADVGTVQRALQHRRVFP